MKKNIFLLFILYNFSISQNINKSDLETLIGVANQLEKEIDIKKDSLNIVNEQIKLLENQKYIKEFTQNNIKIKATCRKSSKIRSDSDPFSKVITLVNEGDSLELSDYKQGYWFVYNGKYYGYLSELYINESDDLSELKKQLSIRNEKLQKKQDLHKEELKKIENKKKTKIAQEKEIKYKESIFNKYGKKLGNRLLSGDIWIGMTSDMALISKGKPKNINTTVGAFGTTEQWVYNRIYLYFENGYLTTYQEFN